MSLARRRSASAPTVASGLTGRRSTQSRWQQLRSAVRDLPTVVRYGGHLALVLFLLFLSWDLPFGELQTPALGGQLVVPQQEGLQEPTLLETEAGTRAHFLEPDVVPVTLKAMRGVSLPARAPERAKETSVLVYRVRPGDTVLNIAQTFGLEGNSVLWANEDLAENPDFLQVGQELYILPVDGAYHTVAQGETVVTIARIYKVTADVITGFSGNGLEPPFTLTIGQKLVVPGGRKPYVPRHVHQYSGPIPKGAKKGTGVFGWPMAGYITQRYWPGHQAIDIGAPKGTSIVAADSGYVVRVQSSDRGYGRMVIVDHGNGFSTLYAHMSVYHVQVGQSVAKGQTIGLCGSTGNSTGPHLHFEIIKNGVRRNPLLYLP